MSINPITPDKADVIRARFMARAATLRHEADFMEAAAPQTAARMRRIADSQERMAVKRYESDADHPSDCLFCAAGEGSVHNYETSQD